MNKEARGFWSVGGCKIIEDPRIPIEKDDKPSFDKEAFRDLIENMQNQTPTNPMYSITSNQMSHYMSLISENKELKAKIMELENE